MHRLFFITSNPVKLVHVQFAARHYDVEIVPKRSYGVAYSEPRSLDREYILQSSFNDAFSRWKKTVANPDDNLFFIEDTSVVIDSLSHDREVPGVDVKYWMQGITFEKLNDILVGAGSDRRATVRSDVVLYLPAWLREARQAGQPYKVFTNLVRGYITDKEYEIKTNPLYPWLDDRSFNRWFVPEGCDKPLSKLPISRAEKHDFRAGAVQQMLEFLQNVGLICEKPHEITRTAYLPFKERAPIFLICGLPCAGKTTLGERLDLGCGLVHVEASDFMRMAYLKRHGFGSSVTIEQFAEKALKASPEIVVDEVIQELAKHEDMPAVITGFRSDLELSTFRQKYSGAGRIEEFYIDADAAKRFKRSRLRDRADAVATFREFRERDLIQMRMGLTRVKSLLHNRVLLNNASREEFVEDFTEMTGLAYAVVAPTPGMPPAQRPRSLMEAVVICLTILNDKYPEKYFTTTKIAAELNALFPQSRLRTSKNNVSRLFNFSFYPYFKVHTWRGKRSYRISATGLSWGRALLKPFKPSPVGLGS